MTRINYKFTPNELKESQEISKETTKGIFFNVVGREMTEAGYIDFWDIIKEIDKENLDKPENMKRVYNIMDYCQMAKNRE